MRVLRKFTIVVPLGALVAALTLSGCGTTVVSAPSNPTANTATAPGSGTISAPPDEAVMSFGVQAQAKDAKSALDKASAKANKVSSAIEGAGVADKDIQTTNVSIDPQYANTSSANPPIVGYSASVSVSAKVRDLASLSKVIGVATKAGVNNVNGPTFSIADDSPVRVQAIQKAVDDARRVAAAMAKAAHKTLGGVVSVSSGSSNNYPVPLQGASANFPMADTALKVQTGQLDVTTNVTVVFELK